MAAHAKHWPPVTAHTLREHGQQVQWVGWFFLLVAVIIFALSDSPGGYIAAILVAVAGLVKVIVGLKWRGQAEQ